MNFKKSKLALATAVAIGAVSLSAQANDSYEFEIDATEAAVNVMGDDDSTITHEEARLVLDVTDNIIGRTTGFGIRLTVGGADVAAINAPPTLGDAAPAWSIDQITPSGNVITLTINPDTPGTSILETGNLLVVDAGALLFDNVDGGDVDIGDEITITAEVFDSNTATVIGTADEATVVEFVESVDVAINDGFECNDFKIDVGSDDDQSSKTIFSSTGEIGLLDQSTVNVGVIDVDSLEESVAGTNATDHNDGANAFQLDIAVGPDSVNIVVEGTDFSSFYGAGGVVWIDAAGFCNGLGTAAGALVNGSLTDINTFNVVAADGSSVEFEFDVVDPLDHDLAVCLTTDGTTQIEAQELTATVAVDLDPEDGGNAAGVLVDPAVATLGLCPLDFNGDVVTVYTVNPATNTAQQSFLRISNTGTAGGLVTIEGVDDEGVDGSVATLTLGAGESTLLTAQDLESGNADKGVSGGLGDGAGKWVVTVTAEFDGLVVTNLARTPDGQLNNLTSSASNSARNTIN